LAADFTTVRTGSKNCWPHWIQGEVVKAGTNIANDRTILQDRYVWLTTEGISCAKGTGYENCSVKKTTDCNASKLARLGIGKTSTFTCVPSFTW